MTDMMKNEFRPFKVARSKNELLSLDDTDYNLAKIRQRINEVKVMRDMVQ